MNRIILTLTALLLTASLPARGEQVKLSELISLRSTDDDVCPAETFSGARLINDLVLPDASSQPFAIPKGLVLVVTDVTFRVSPFTGLPSNETRVRLGTPCDVPGPSCMKSWLDAIVPGGTGELRISLQRGFAIAGNAPICVASLDGGSFTFAELYGYLAQLSSSW